MMEKKAKIIATLGPAIYSEKTLKKIIMNKINAFLGNNVVEKIKLTTFEGKQEKFKEKTQKDVTKSKYIRKISSIKNEKIKNSLIGLSKLLKRK